MLQLQRASAGSGKTYLLAKKFIEYFISRRDENGRRRLRRPRELRDSLQHILAITFTNKATNEMKLRIVDKLDALGRWTPGTPTKKVDYLEDFIKEFGCTPEEVAETCNAALKTILTDYGDFKVSTIDSFFQTVLRTFAYEADLDDTYQIELDSNYVTQMGLDTTLDEIETAGSRSQGLAWVERMMEDKATSGKGWNIFQKKDNRNSVYGQILTASRNLAKEDFKEIREKLDEYFEENPDFFNTYHRLRDIYEKGAREAHSRMRTAARKVRNAFREAGLDMGQTGGTYLASRVNKMSDLWKWNHSKEADIKFKIPEFTRKGATTRVFNPKAENPHLGTPTEDHIESLAREMYEAFGEWREEIMSEKFRKWNIYSATMPYVGVLQSVRDNSRLFLTDSNTVELGETNSILHRIIGEDDAPFVYERIGSRLEHFLIDEFQDTSRLQWKNLYPLLLESEGKGFDNLIIGDAKQSIYRFRNADPSLITTTVPEQFPDTCRQCGNTPAENTNWRSSRRIVEFNNLFFRFFTRELSPEMETLYSNTVQPPHHKEDAGYVSLRLFETSADEDIPAHFAEIPGMIEDMLARGYEMKDIAVLVDTRRQGEMVIESIMNHNRREDTSVKIDFISADSLRTGESVAVQSVISILEAINNGTKAELRPPDERRQKGIGDWSKLKADFSFFAMHHQEMSLSEQLTHFLNGEYDPDSIKAMLAEMSTTVLPALVEKIIHHFIPSNMRDSDAPFLAALQDSVIDFCDSHTSDIASFLKWWEKKGSSLSISSPEGADAVQIMTVHKSKGLEFRCVIVPWSKQTVKPSPNEKEWLWVKPDLREAGEVPTLPWIPVWSDSKLEDTIHAAAYQDYLKKYLTDKVNMAYVAYTRAVDELYIFTPCNLKDGKPTSGRGRIGEYLWRLGTDADNIIAEIAEAYPDSRDYIPREGEFEADEECLTWEFGHRPDRSEVIATTLSRSKEEGGPKSQPITGYFCGTEIPALKYKDPSAADMDHIETGDEEPEAPEPEETDDNRERGEMLHAVMERLRTPADLPSALRRMRIKGHISRLELPELERELSAALESVAGYGWFDAGCRVINERAIAVKGRLQRPDRIVIRPDGTGVVIDYKFGDKRNDAAYGRQVRRYADLVVRTGLAKKCEAYIWYVGLGDIVDCSSR